jgi:hypothetical protein
MEEMEGEECQNEKSKERDPELHTYSSCSQTPRQWVRLWPAAPPSFFRVDGQKVEKWDRIKQPV